jgi:hypothetical protein
MGPRTSCIDSPILKRSAGDLEVLFILNSIKLDLTTPPRSVNLFFSSRHSLDAADVLATFVCFFDFPVESRVCHIFAVVIVLPHGMKSVFKYLL